MEKKSEVDGSILKGNVLVENKSYKKCMQQINNYTLKYLKFSCF